MNKLSDDLREAADRICGHNGHEAAMLAEGAREAADELDRLEAKLKDADILEQVLRGDLERTRGRARELAEQYDVATANIIELLATDDLDEDRIVQALQQARALGETATSRRTRREDRLRALGFEDPTNDERRERLARNAALKDWPKR